MPREGGRDISDMEGAEEEPRRGGGAEKASGKRHRPLAIAICRAVRMHGIYTRKQHCFLLLIRPAH